MTQNQISYLSLLEDRLHNRNTEAENYRSNKAREDENFRHNLATETEVNRHNTITEQQGWEQIKINRDTQQETARHNRAIEGIEWYKADSQYQLNKQRIEESKSNAALLDEKKKYVKDEVQSNATKADAAAITAFAKYGDTAIKDKTKSYGLVGSGIGAIADIASSVIRLFA